MMRALNLKEFAEELRRKGDWREADFGDEILALLDLEDEIAEPYRDILADLERRAEHFSNPDDPIKAVEWLGDRSDMLADIEAELVKAEMADGDADVAVKELISERENFETIMRKHGGWTEGDLQDGLFALIERAKPEYDL